MRSWADGKVDRSLRLAVGDEVIIRLDACGILKGAGFRCLDAGPGDEAVEVLEAKSERIVVVSRMSRCPATRTGTDWPELSPSGGLMSKSSSAAARAVRPGCRGKHVRAWWPRR
jgi:hypothetical protein